MIFLLDTSVLITAANSADPARSVVTRFLKGLQGSGNELCIATQILHEYWVVATRPISVNGLGASPGDVRRQIEGLRSAYRILGEAPNTTDVWLQLCESYAVKGRLAHDVRLVALMLSHRLQNLVTRNMADFSRFKEIQCVEPA